MYSMYFTITSRCNQNCLCCPYTEDDPQLPDVLMTDLQQTVDRIFQQSPKGQKVSVVLSGGEPTLHPQFPEIIQSLQKRGCIVHILSNGERFSDDVFLNQLDAVSDWEKIYVTTTLHSEKPELHEQANQKKGSFVRSVSGLHKLENRGAHVTVKHCITGSNVSDLCSFYEFVDREFGVGVPLYLCGIDYVGIPDVLTARERIGLPQIRCELERLFDLAENTGSGRRVYATHIPLCWADPYYWKYLTLNRTEFYYNASGRYGETNLEMKPDSATDDCVCEECKVRHLCMGTYKSAFHALPASAFKPYR